jgi:hypothetical protein
MKSSLEPGETYEVKPSGLLDFIDEAILLHGQTMGGLPSKIILSEKAGLLLLGQARKCFSLFDFPIDLTSADDLNDRTLFGLTISVKKDLSCFAVIR